jgi:ribonuclease HI
MNHSTRTVIVHADESCLGNQNEGLNPGGAGALVEARTADGVARRDLTISSPATTNNQMALAGAIEVLERLKKPNGRRPILYLSDSQYLVNGMTSWVQGWKARGWKRKGGEILNLDLWKELNRVSADFDIRYVWVRGHAGHVKNEYADFLAVQAAQRQTATDGFVDSQLTHWLKAQQAKGKFAKYDPDADFDALVSRHGRS